MSLSLRLCELSGSSPCQDPLDLQLHFVTLQSYNFRPQQFLLLRTFRAAGGEPLNCWGISLSNKEEKEDI